MSDVTQALRERWKHYRDLSTAAGYSIAEHLTFGGRAGGILEAIELIERYATAPSDEELAGAGGMK